MSVSKEFQLSTFFEEFFEVYSVGATAKGLTHIECKEFS